MSYRHFIVEPISPNQVNVVEEGNDKIAARFGNYAAAVAFAQAENMRRAQADAVKVAAHPPSAGVKAVELMAEANNPYPLP